MHPPPPPGRSRPDLGCFSLWLLSQPSSVCISTPAHPSFSTLGFCCGHSSPSKKCQHQLPQEADLVCKMICAFSPRLISRRKASSVPLGPCPPLPLQPCSSTPPRAWSSSHWPGPGGLGRPSREEAGLRWPGSSSETGPSGTYLVSLPCLLALDTPQAGSSPSTPPTSFPPPEAEVTGSPGPGGAAIITCQLGEEVRFPGGCCLSH